MLKLNGGRILIYASRSSASCISGFLGLEMGVGCITSDTDLRKEFPTVGLLFIDIMTKEASTL